MVPGQILNQAEAEAFGTRLFGSLLTTDRPPPEPSDLGCHARLGST